MKQTYSRNSSGPTTNHNPVSKQKTDRRGGGCQDGQDVPHYKKSQLAQDGDCRDGEDATHYRKSGCSN